MIIILEVVEGPEAGRTVTVNDGHSCLIGRVSGDLVLEKDPLISGQHMSISNNGSTCLVEDLASRNHVFVDGKQIPPSIPTAVGDQCQIKAGTTTVIRVNILPDPIAKQNVDDGSIPNGGTSGLNTVNPMEENGDSIRERQVSNFGFDLNSIDVEDDVLRGNVKESLSHSEDVETGSTSPFENKASPFDFGSGDDFAADDSNAALPIPDSKIDSASEEVAPSGVPRENSPSAGEKISSNFSESIYIPGQGTTAHIPIAANPASLTPPNKTKIEFERIISEDGVYVFGGVAQSEDAAGAVNDLLERLSNLGTIVCLTHSFERELTNEKTGDSDDDDGALSENALSAESDLILDEAGSNQVATTALFDWLPKEVASSAGPVMFERSELPDSEELNSNQWGGNSIMWLLGADKQEIFDHLKSIVRMDLKTGKQVDGVLGICWPNILSSILDGREVSAVSKIFDTALHGILYEDPEEKYVWRFASTIDLSEKMRGLAIFEKDLSI